MQPIQLTDIEDDWIITLTYHSSNGPVRKEQFTLNLKDIRLAELIIGTAYFKIKTHSGMTLIADRRCWLDLKRCFERANLPHRFTLGGIYS